MGSPVTIMVQLKLLVAFFTLTSANYDSPISPADYSPMIGQGFDTSYFSKDVPLLSEYHRNHTVDVFKAGYRNLRLRCSGVLHRSDNDAAFDEFLNALEIVVDDCLEIGVIPIICWSDNKAEERANETDRLEFISWWRKVAERLMNKDYRLGLNLFTELTKKAALYMDINIYSNWTAGVIEAIRNAGGNNGERMLMLASPRKSSTGLNMIDAALYQNDSYVMAEWHAYAGGPNKRGAKYWEGCGTHEQRQRVTDLMEESANFTKQTGILSYFGAWRSFPVKGSEEINQTEAQCFGCFFAEQLKNYSIPWSLNVLHFFYDLDNSEWYTDLLEIPKKSGNFYNTTAILNEIKRCGM